jgi:hypothetical protein
MGVACTQAHEKRAWRTFELFESSMRRSVDVKHNVA